MFQKSINITIDSKCRLFQNLHGALGERFKFITLMEWQMKGPAAHTDMFPR